MRTFRADKKMPAAQGGGLAQRAGRTPRARAVARSLNRVPEC